MMSVLFRAPVTGPGGDGPGPIPYLLLCAVVLVGLVAVHALVPR